MEKRRDSEYSQVKVDPSRALLAGGTRDMASFVDSSGDAFDLFGEAPAAGSAGTSHRPLSLSMFYPYKWMILGVFVLVSGIALPLIWYLMKPVYMTSAIVRVSPVVPRIAFQTEDNGIVPFYQAFLNTQVSVIQSPTVLQRVLERPDVQATKWYREPPQDLRVRLGGTPPSRLERLRNAIGVRPRMNTELIDVTMTAAAPEDATVIVNAVVEEYKHDADERLKQADIQRFEILTGELENLKGRIEADTAARYALLKSYGTLDPDKVREQRTARLNSLLAQRDDVQYQHELIRWELESLPSAETETEASDEPAQPAEEDQARRFLRDAEWRQLSTDLENIKNELELARQKYGEYHPKIQEGLTRIEHARHLLENREQQLKETWDSLVGQAEAMGPEGAQTLSRAGWERLSEKKQYELKLLENMIERERRTVAASGDAAAMIDNYDERIRFTREMEETFRSRLRALELEQKAPARISVASQAIQPSKPHRDRRLMMACMVMAGSLAGGVGLAFARISLSPKIREAEDVQHTVHLPFLGHLPKLSPEATHGSDADPHAVEGVRMIRTALLQRIRESQTKTILITSASSASGKTTVAIQLARSLAYLGKKILLVETDLRAPAMADRLGIASGKGLSDLLLDRKATDETTMISSDVEGLKILLAGERAQEVPIEMLANGLFSQCVSRWKQQYDLIIFDSPPVLPVADARILAGQVDGTLMIVRSSRCRQTDVVQAFADLCAAGAKLLGTVLVGGHPRLGYGYGYGYGYGHTYGHAYGRTRDHDSTSQREEPETKSQSTRRKKS